MVIKNSGARGPVLLAVMGLAMPGISGCSSMPSLITTGSAFSNASNIDRTFIGASQTWDLDKNGIVSCDEWKNYALTLFRESDMNGDSALDAQEFAKMAKSDRLFDMADLRYYDANGDGKVTADELTGKPNRAFQLLDKNGDCQIARDESAQTVQVDKVKDKGPDTEAQAERIGKPGH